MIGCRIIDFKGIAWRLYRGVLIPLSPPKKLTTFSISDAQVLLKKTGAYLVRWESDFDSSSARKWWHVIKDVSLKLNDYSKKVRYLIRKGLDNYECSIVSKDVILNEGYEVYRRVFLNHATHEKILSKADFIEAITSLSMSHEFWAVRDKTSNLLVGFSENYIESNVCFYNTIWITSEALRKGASYALFYEMDFYYLTTCSFLYVSDGARSLSHSTEIQDFLQKKFGYRVAYSNLNIFYSPFLRLAVFLLYPFGSIIRLFKNPLLARLSILLDQDRLRHR